jgi:hypothetical protein
MAKTFLWHQVSLEADRIHLTHSVRMAVGKHCLDESLKTHRGIKILSDVAVEMYLVFICYTSHQIFLYLQEPSSGGADVNLSTEGALYVSTCWNNSCVDHKTLSS